MKQLLDTLGIKNLKAKISIKFINRETKNSNNNIVINNYFNAPVNFHLKESIRKIKDRN